MLSFPSKAFKIRFWFFALWIVVNLIQIIFMEAFHDEAYYWMYAQQLDWGYFDHPPFIALMIKLGGLLFDGNLGLRIMTLLLSFVTILGLERLIQPKSLLLFYKTMVSFAILQIIGFLAVPDIPLFCFTVLFTLVFKYFLESPTTKLTIALGVLMALLMYSKYHAVLVIAFLILGHYKLLFKPRIWMAIAVGVLLYVPHILWQIDHDFATIIYQGKRSDKSYRIKWTLEFIGQVALILGPFITFPFIYHIFKTKFKQRFEKALKFQFIGILLFFLLMSFLGKIEANWLIIAIVPFFYLGYRLVEEKLWYNRFMRIQFPVILILILCARMVMIFPQITEGILKPMQFHYQKEFNQAIIEKIPEDAIPVFRNRYYAAAKYQYYTGKTAYNYSDVIYKFTQYNFWDYKDSLNGKRIAYFGDRTYDSLPYADTKFKRERFTVIDNFLLQDVIDIKAEGYLYNMKLGTNTKRFNLEVQSEINYPELLEMEYYIFKDDAVYSRGDLDSSLDLRQSKSIKITARILLPQELGDYRVLFTTKQDILHPPMLMNSIYFSIEQ